MNSWFSRCSIDLLQASNHINCIKTIISTIRRNIWILTSLTGLREVEGDLSAVNVLAVQNLQSFLSVVNGIKVNESETETNKQFVDKISKRGWPNVYSRISGQLLFIRFGEHVEVTNIRHCGLVVSTPAWDGTGCEFDSWQCRIYIPCARASLRHVRMRSCLSEART